MTYGVICMLSGTQMPFKPKWNNPFFSCHQFEKSCLKIPDFIDSGRRWLQMTSTWPSRGELNCVWSRLVESWLDFWSHGNTILDWTQRKKVRIVNWDRGTLGTIPSRENEEPANLRTIQSREPHLKRPATQSIKSVNGIRTWNQSSWPSLVECTEQGKNWGSCQLMRQVRNSLQ
jgi:hypothetical protein